MDCQNLTSKINFKYMNLSNFYDNHIRNKSSVNFEEASEKHRNDCTTDKQENKLEYSLELLDVNYPNEFLQEIRHLCQLTSSSSSSLSSLSSLKGISSEITTSSPFASAQIICQCNILQNMIDTRLREIHSRLVYNDDQLTLMMIEQIMFDLFEIQLPNQKVSSKLIICDES
ncbi:unnamed protein product [Schistosoma turkestanicum]|nr:unnamed protein product [Schistosoma turkestanicum]